MSNFGNRNVSRFELALFGQDHRHRFAGKTHRVIRS